MIGAASLGGYFAPRLWEAPTSQVPATGTPAQNRTAAESTTSQAGQTEIRKPIDEETRRPAVLEYREHKPMIGPWLAAGIILLFSLLIGLAVALELIRRARRETIIEDRATFRTALDIWAPAAFSVHGTPREQKRFLNRVRFMATAISDPGDGPNTEDTLRDESVVALTALAHLHRDIVVQLSNGETDLVPAIRASHVTSNAIATRDPALNPRTQYLAALSVYRKQCPNSPLTAETATQCLVLWGQIRTGLGVVSK